jgi:hypothetical protein
MQNPVNPRATRLGERQPTALPPPRAPADPLAWESPGAIGYWPNSATRISK